MAFPKRRVFSIVILTVGVCIATSFDADFARGGGPMNLPAIILSVLYLAIFIIAGSIVTEPDPDPPAY